MAELPQDAEGILPYVNNSDWPKDPNTPVYGHVIGEPSDLGWTRYHRCDSLFDDWGPNTLCAGELPVACHLPDCEVHARPEVIESDRQRLVTEFYD